MSAYYLDASAAVKGYVAENGSSRIIGLLDSPGEPRLYMSRVGAVEVAADIFGKVKSGQTSMEEATSAVVRLKSDLETVYEIVEIGASTTERAMDIARIHQLRAYDCLQLVTVLLLQEQRSLARMEALTLVSSDVDLNEAAEAEGLVVENPAA